MKRHDVWLRLGEVAHCGLCTNPDRGTSPKRSLHQFMNLRNLQVIHAQMESAKSDPA